MIPYIKYIIRNLWRTKLTSFINITGLSVALSAAIVLALWLLGELNHNIVFKDSKRLFQIVTHIKVNSQTESYRSTSLPIIRSFEDVSIAQEVFYSESIDDKLSISVNGDKQLYPNGKRVSPNFLRGLGLNFLYGDPNQEFSTPSSVIITKALALKLFGTDWMSYVGKSPILFSTGTSLDIKAVIDDLPKNTTIKFDYCIPLVPPADSHIGSINYDTYILLRSPDQVIQAENAVNTFIDGKLPGRISLQNIEAVYLHSNFTDGKPDGGRISYVRLFGVATLFIVIIAAINFVNLFTASSFNRCKDIAVRTISGASKITLIGRLLAESLFMTALAGVLAVVLVYLLLPFIQTNLQSELKLPLSSPLFWVSLTGLSAVIGCLAGFYPALLMTSFHPQEILKSNGNLKIGGFGVRNTLFAIQFFISLVLMNFTFGVNSQIKLLEDKDLGFEKDHLLVKRLSAGERQKTEVIKNRLHQFSFFTDVTVSGSELINGVPMTSDVLWPNKSPEDSSRFGVLFVDDEFIEAMKIQTVVGSFPKHKNESVINVVVNERALSLLGERKNVIGLGINVWGSDATVTGVIKDFNFSSLFNAVQPLILVDMPQETEFLFARVKVGDEKNGIDVLRSVHHELSPGEAFHFQWLDENLSAQYKNESLTALLAKAFSIVMAIITVMGFFGLSDYAFQQKTKEVGIRKILGAPYPNILALLFWNFFRIILISVFIAIPVSMFFVTHWLQKFAFRTQISLIDLLVPAGILVMASAVAGLYHSLKAYWLSPAFTLKEN
jgi:putative ABC transport system permease protein